MNTKYSGKLENDSFINVQFEGSTLVHTWTGGDIRTQEPFTSWEQAVIVIKEITGKKPIWMQIA